MRISTSVPPSPSTAPVNDQLVPPQSPFHPCSDLSICRAQDTSWRTSWQVAWIDNNKHPLRTCSTVQVLQVEVGTWNRRPGCGNLKVTSSPLVTRQTSQRGFSTRVGSFLSTDQVLFRSKIVFGISPPNDDSSIAFIFYHFVAIGLQVQYFTDGILLLKSDRADKGDILQ